jgi:DNA-binding transcriptional regulator YiaG
MNSLKETLERVEVEEPVHIPTLDGKGIAETVHVKVPAWKDPRDGEIYLDEAAHEILDKTKARYMGLLSADRISRLRERHRLTQAKIAQLFQLGEKTWTRWESGRERPSRSMNTLLRAFEDGKIDEKYLNSIQKSSATRKPSVFVPYAQENVEGAEKLFRESFASLYAGSVTVGLLRRELESKVPHQIRSYVEVFRNYDRQTPVKPETEALMLYRNRLLSEGPNRVPKLRRYSGRVARNQGRLANEEVAA